MTQQIEISTSSGTVKIIATYGDTAIVEINGRRYDYSRMAKAGGPSLQIDGLTYGFVRVLKGGLK